LSEERSGIFDPDLRDEEPADLSDEKPEGPAQAGVEVDSSRYYQTRFLGVAIGKDGMPIVGDGKTPEPEEGLTDANFICAESEDGSRPACSHLVTLVLPADGVAKGFGELRQIRQFCKWLATASEQWEHRGNVYACDARTPQDPVSIRVIRDFRQRQKDLARETAEKSGSLDF
jgi:hypothetical protein